MPSTNGHGPKRAILYARVSTDEQARSGYSLAQQLEALRGYAVSEGYEVLEEVMDPGQSGASLERPGMDHVRDLVDAGGVSVVLAHDRDRFAREPAYHYFLKREFEEHGTNRPARQAGAGEDSRADQARQTPEGPRGPRRRRSAPTYGFRHDKNGNHFVLHEPEMAVVEKIFRLAAEGLGVRAIQKRLHSEAIPSPKGGVCGQGRCYSVS